LAIEALHIEDLYMKRSFFLDRIYEEINTHREANFPVDGLIKHGRDYLYYTSYFLFLNSFSLICSISVMLDVENIKEKELRNKK